MADRTRVQGVPAEVVDAARRRSEARAARDWDAADALRAEIEAAGWKVVDAGTDYRLERATPPDVEVGGEIRYGSSGAVPSRLDEAATGLASVVLVASPDAEETGASLRGLLAGAPAGTAIVVVADGLSDRTLEPLRPLLVDTESADDTEPHSIELVRTSEPIGHAAALNAGIRRAAASVVLVLDPSIEPAGDVVTPLVRALDDPGVAVAGPFGLASADLRRFEEVDAGTPAQAGAAAIQGYLMAFRRADFVARGPLDEAFRFYRNLDIWWSLVLRDEGEDAAPRRAELVPGLPLRRGEPHAWRFTPPAERDRLSKRNFYRILDRFRTREDLAAG
jgi:GT2 family glycosyltransferase